MVRNDDLLGVGMTEQEQKPANQEIDECLQAVNDSMTDGLGKLAEYFGFNKVMGQIYAALLLSAEPMSLDDLAEHWVASSFVRRRVPCVIRHFPFEFCPATKPDSSPSV